MIPFQFYHILLWLICLFPFKVSAKHDTLEHVSVLGCSFYLAMINTWDFNNTENTRFYNTICTYQPAFESWAICVYDSVNRDNTTFEKSLYQIQLQCHCANSSNSLSLQNYYDALNNGSIYARPEPTNNGKINFPIHINDTIRNQIIFAYHTYGRNLDISNRYGAYIYIYFIFVLVVATFLNYSQYTAFSNTLFKYKLIRWTRGRLIIPTLLKQHADYFVKGKYIIALIPTRSEALIISGYILHHIYLLSVGYEFDSQGYLFPSMRLQKLRFFADRAGILAFANFPLIILLSTRNTICEYLTDVKYSSLIMFHKWIGRIMFIDVILHGGAYLVYAMMTKSFGTSSKQAYYKFGILACFILLVLVVFSFGYFRRYYYETFLYGHIILAIWFFYICWKHVENLGWKEWIYSAIFIWALERAIRWFRLLNSGLLNAHLQLIGDDLIKISIDKPKDHFGLHFYLNSKPGQYYFIYFIHPMIFWQSHPFSVMNFDRKIVMVIKPKGGVTKYLQKMLKKSYTGELDIKVGIEGPYGTSAPLHHSNDIAFLTGGSGLPGPLSHILNLTSKPNLHCNISLYTVVRDINILHAFKEELFKLQESSVNIYLFITHPNVTNFGNNISPTSSGSNCQTALLSSNKDLEHLETFCTIYYHRPNIPQIISKLAKGNSSLSIICCGPPPFVDVTRNFTAEAILQNKNKSINYYEEFQCW